MAAGDASAGPPGRVEAESAASVYYAPNARTAGQFERGETEITSSIHSGVRAGLDLHERVRVIRSNSNRRLSSEMNLHPGYNL